MPEQIDPPPPSSETSLERQLNDAVADPPESPKAFLLVVDGERAGRLHLLGGQPVIIGRAPEAEIRVEDPSASGRHARIALDGGAFQIEDSASRNGTAVNGELVTRHLLRHKDAIRIGETTFVFLASSPEGDLRNYMLRSPSMGSSPPSYITQTSMQQVNPSTALTTTRMHQAALAYHPQAMLPQQQLMHPFPQGYVQRAEEEPEEKGGEAGLVDMVRAAFRMLAILKRNAWILVPLPIVCALVGWTSFYWLPASQLSEATIRLTHFKTNISAIASDSQRAGGARPVFFADPFTNFAREDIVRQTLADFQLPDNADTLGDAMKALAIWDDPNAQGIYKVTFTQPAKAPLAPPVPFLRKHLDNYLRAEVDRSIKTLKGESDFLQKQLENVATELQTVENLEKNFKEKHIDSLPERAGVVFSSRQTLMDRKQSLETEIDRLRQQLTNARQQLSRSSTSITPSQSDVTPLSNLLITKRDNLAKLKATGLTDQHPQVRAAQIEVDQLEKEIISKRTKGLSKLEWETDPRYQQLQQDAERIEGDLKVDQSELARLESQLNAASGKVADAPRVEFQLNDLNRKQGSLQQLQGELFQQHRKTLVQIELETADVHGHYEILTGPVRVNTKTAKFVAQRIGAGLGGGVALAALLVALVEFRRFLRRHPELRTAA